MVGKFLKKVVTCENKINPFNAMNEVTRKEVMILVRRFQYLVMLASISLSTSGKQDVDVQFLSVGILSYRGYKGTNKG